MLLDSAKWAKCRDEAQSAVEKAMKLASDRAQPGAPDEPGIIACLVECLAIDWGLTLTGILETPVSVSGIFCHQSPIVEFNNPRSRSCELGDLMIVHWDESQSSTNVRALLLQAKKTDHLPTSLSPSDSQLHLYSDWPVFGIKRPKNGFTRYVRYDLRNGKGQSFRIDPSKTHALYLLVHWVGRAGRSMDIAIPNQSLDRCCAFPVVLADLIAGKSGVPVDIQSRGNADWSGLVLDVLDYSFGTKFNRASVKLKSEPRFKGNVSSDYRPLKCDRLFVSSLLGGDVPVPIFQKIMYGTFANQRRMDADTSGGHIFEMDPPFGDDVDGLSIVVIHTRSK